MIRYSPFDAPGTYSLLAHTELAEGVFYPRGGFHKVVETIEALAKDKFGVNFRFSTPVAKVLLSKDNKRAVGVTLETGEELRADVVVVNADLVYAHEKLLPRDARSERISKKESSCSSISFYWSMKKVVDTLETHSKPL